jgi:hypothetical protein
MAGIPISGLPPIVTPLATDLIPSVQSGVTYKETVTQLSTLLNSTLAFLPLVGGTMTGGINMGGNQINNMADPTLAQDAATKHYVDAVASGIIILPAAAVATTANLTATYNNGSSGVGATLTNSGTQVAFMVDGVSPAINSIVLVKNQTATADNGIYTLTTIGTGSTNWVLTRSTNYDMAGQIVPGTVVVINAGTVNASTTWIQTATVTTVGTDPILFSLFNANIYALKGANDDITSMSALTGYLQAPLGVQDSNGNLVVTFGSQPSAVNYIGFANNTTGNSPVIVALGSDSNISLQLNGKGTSGVNIEGTTTNNSAPAGFVGEDFSLNLPYNGGAGGIIVASATNTDLLSQLLQPGNYDVWGNVLFATDGLLTSFNAWIYTVSTTEPDASFIATANVSSSSTFGATVPQQVLKISSPTTVYLTCQISFSGATIHLACGNLYIRRRY